MGRKGNPLRPAAMVVAGAVMVVALLAVDGRVDLIEAEAGGLALVLVAALITAVRARDAELIAELRAAARTDPLTGALNRRGFTESFQVEIDRATRNAEPVSLVIGDLDAFKQVNDRLGHMGGDMALERASALLARSMRSGDVLARLGGEEFAVVLPGAGGKQALAVAERLRGAVETGFDGRPVSVTISIGVATYPDDGLILEEILHAADLAMYTAKGAGKNRCCRYAPEIEISGNEGSPARPALSLVVSEPQVEP